MTPIQDCIQNKNTKTKPIWIMRQAGRYLPEFREIRCKNPDFIKLCLNENLSAEITLQPIKRFKFDAAIIFSDILMLPYGMGQEVKFEKGLGPILGDLNIEKILNTNQLEFNKKLNPVYKSISNVSNDPVLHSKDLIGFVGAPWTILVYMINRISPKKNLSENFFKDKLLINELLSAIEKFLKIHIENQIKAGATIIQIFDSWAGLLKDNISKYIYEPTFNLVNHVKKMGVPSICFPKGINNYTSFCEAVNPDVVNIDHDVDPNKIIKEIKIPVQGGLDPKILLTDKGKLKKEVEKYLDIFKDHPYVFNLGHGILPETKIEMVNELVNIVRSYK
jgi:uroporphyrinogen decarboxylase|tara:strand:+ start:108 stop:1109 length:1002 start_codon:yes stop_codon:yes gene_type:complete